MTQETTTNERAFITVSQELIRKQNDLDVLRKMESIGQGISEWNRKMTSALTPDRVHSEGLEGASRVVHYLGNISELRKEIVRVEARIEQLKVLADAFMRGQDIVQLRLSQE